MSSVIHNKLADLGAELGAIDGAVVLHYWHPRQQAPYILWQEDSAETFKSDNKSSEIKWVGVVDFYTQTEFDETLDSIIGALDSVGAIWKISSVDFEDDTKLIHFTVNWELM